MATYFEDYEDNATFTTPGRTMTEADIVNFAGITGDWGEMHTNREYAESHRFGSRVAHGALVFSLSTGLVMRGGIVDEDGLVAFYGVDELQFRRPTYIGDTVTVVATVRDRTERDDDGIVALDVDLQNQDDETVISYVMTVLVEKG